MRSSDDTAMPCKKKSGGYGESRRLKGNCKSKFACIVEAGESTRLRMEGNLHTQKKHENHIAGKGSNSLQHHSLVHYFIPMPQAMKIPAAKAAVDE